jgi:hypothetical protein
VEYGDYIDILTCLFILQELQGVGKEGHERWKSEARSEEEAWEMASNGGLREIADEQQIPAENGHAR